jgi:two-component system OmpR family sensor kinase
VSSRSLRRTLGVWVLGALSLGSVVLALVTYVATLEEMDEVFNETVRQTALALADYEHSDPDVSSRPESPLPESLRAPAGDEQIVTVTWSPTGRRRFISDPRIEIPLSRVNGLTRVTIAEVTWYVYTIVEASGIVQAAQRASARRQAAAEATGKLLVPLFLLVVLIGVLLVIALRRGLKPLDQSVQEVAARSASSLLAIDITGLPVEIHPLVAAINDLLDRLAHAFDHQRRFVADAAHELRTPVTALRLQLQLLQRATDPAERAAALEDLARGTARTEHLLQQLLQLSRAEPQAQMPSLRTEPVSLLALARAVVGSFSINAENRNIDLGVKAGEDGDRVTVAGDPEMLLVMLNNLVDNALRYTPPGGVVDVVVQGSAADTSVVRVIDSGPGVADADLPWIFDRFYRAAETAEGPAGAEGSGLGLSIVKAIVDLHGATITVRNRNGTDSGLVCEVCFTAPLPDAG